MIADESAARDKLRKRGLYHAPLRESDIAILSPERARLRAQVRDGARRAAWLEQRREDALPLGARIARAFRRIWEG